MIKDFSVENYRRFKKFRIDNLGRVNVFVGKNNAGKTSMLEALYLYSMGMDVEVLQAIALRRGELAVDMRSSSQHQVDYSHFYNGHKIRNNEVLQLGTETNYYKMTILPNPDPVLLQSLFALDPDPVEADSLVRFIATIFQAKGDNTDRKISEIGLTTEGIAVRNNRFTSVSTSNRNKNYFISPDSLDNAVLATLWNKIQMANKEGEIINALQILEPRVRNLGFLLPEQYGRFMSRPLAGVMIGFEGHGKKLPLGSLGDGMKRLLAIALVLCCSKGGALFIDEVDAGFHYSVMKDLWRLIIKTALGNNVQVFVSTHSIDCLRGLSVLGEFAEGDDSVVSMYSIRDDMDAAIHYSADEIGKIIESEIEVR